MAVAPKQNAPEILRKLIPLNTLKDAALKKAAEAADFGKLGKGGLLFSEGDTDNYNVYLLSGEVGLYTGNREMDSVRAGTDTARFPLAHQIPRKFTVKAKSKIEVVRIDNRILGELLAKAGSSDYEVSDFDAEATDDWMSQLLASRVFQLIPASNIQGVMMRMEEMEAKAGDVIIRQGEEGDYFYLINKGRCSVLYTDGEGGEASEVAQLGPGESFGEEALLSDKPRGSTVVMLTEGMLLRLSKEDFIQYVKSPLADTIPFAKAQKQVEQGAVWLDVRQAEAFEERHLPGSINLPFGSLRYQSSSLDPDSHFILYCDDGQLSSTAAYLLVEQGFNTSILEKGLDGVPDTVWSAPEDKVVALRPGDEVGAGLDAQEMVQKLAQVESKYSQQLEQMKKLMLTLEKAKAKIGQMEQEKQEALAQQANELKGLKDEVSKKDGRLEYVEEQLGKVKDLADNLNEKEKALAEAEKKLAQLQEQQAGSEEAAKTQQQQLGSIEKSLKDAMAERDQAAGKLAKLEGRHEEIGKALQAAEEKAKTLEQSLARKNDEATGLDETVVSLKQQLEGETAREAELEQKLQALELESEQAKSELESQHQQALKEAQDALEQERTAHQESRQKIETLESDGANLKETLEKAQAEAADAASKVTALEQAGGESETQHAEALAALQKSLDEESVNKGDLQQQLTALQEEKEKLETEAAASQASTQELTAKLEQLEKAGGESETQHTEALAALQSTLDETRAKGDEAEQKSQSLESDLVGANEKIAQLETQLNEKEQGAQEQQSQLEKQQQEAGEARQQIEALESEKERLQGELDDAAHRASELEASRVAQEEESVAHQADHEKLVAELREELAQATTQGGEAAKRSETLQAEAEGLQEKLTTAETRIGELEQTLAAKAGSEEEAAQWQAQIESLKVELQKGEESLQQANEKTGELENQISERDTEVAALKEQDESLRNELKEVAEAREAAEKSTEELTGQLEARDAEISQLKAQGQQLEESGEELEGLRKSLDETTEAREAAEKRVEELTGQLEARDTEISQLKEQGQQLEASGEELDVLRKELAEAVSARQAAEEAGQVANRQLAELQSGGDELKVLQAELDSLTLALEESDQALDNAEKRVAELESEREELSAESGGAAEQAAALEEERDKRAAAEAEVERLTGEAEELRRVMEENVEQIKQAQGIEGEDVESLRTELQLVRDMAESDLKQMREELEEARAQLQAQGEEGDVAQIKSQLVEAQSRLKEMEVGGSMDVAESEALRQEGDSLRRSIDEREHQIARLQSDLRKLEEGIEDSNGEVDRLKQALEIAQVEADEAEFRSQESVDAKKQVEEALYKLQQQVESERIKDTGDGSALSAKGPLEMAAPSGGGRGMVGIAIGAVVAFVVAEGLSIIGGKGELISGLFADKAEVQAPVPVAETPKIAVTPPPAVEAPREVAPEPEPEPVSEPVVQAEPEPEVTPEPEPAPEPEPEVVEAAPEPARLAMGAKLQDRLRGGGRAPELLYIRGGQFTMGSDRSQLASEERPAHDVAVGDFAIGRYEVTFDDYQRFTRATGRELPDDLGWGKGARPVINVSWEDAVDYTEWLSRQTGESYRLPTEAEWEYAAGAGSDAVYWWGYDLTENSANCFNCGSRWDGVSTAPVGTFPANDFGLHNTAGNVMEWVADCYHFGYDGAPTDGSAWVEPACPERVVKGGAFNKSGDSLRTTKRTPYESETKLFVLGFRVVRDVE
ncbi:MAG: SUMF1/EgtB/PvdO family nonheme iron enzyme [Sedimenticola sp.]